MVFNKVLTSHCEFLVNLVHLLMVMCKICQLKKMIPLFCLICSFFGAKAQKIDSIYFNLYTDSLKKGTHNYISVDGKYNNGRFLPLDSKTIELSATDGTFEGNNLWIPLDFKAEKVTVTAKLKTNPAVAKQITIYIKTRPDNTRLKTPEELLRELEQGTKKTKKNK
jgi:histone acetyltransferase (RNA polymerase elongator complex component)